MPEREARRDERPEVEAGQEDPVGGAPARRRLIEGRCGDVARPEAEEDAAAGPLRDEERDVDTEADREAEDLRNRAATVLQELMAEARLGGAYLFRKEPRLSLLFTATHLPRRGSR